MIKRSPKKTSVKSEAPWMQRACAFLGLLVTVATIIVLGQAAFADPRDPELSIEPLAMRNSSAGWLVEVRVANIGDLTAAQVEIEGEAGGVLSGATLDYVPGRGSKDAVLIFPTSPADAEPRLRIRGWSTP